MKTFYYFKKINLLYIGLMLALTLIVNTNSFSQPTLLGMTSQGGEGAGVIFALSPGASAYSYQYNLSVLNPGNYPKGMVEASNGKLYGTTTFGGALGFGILFEYDIATNSYIKKVDFDGTLIGKHPSGSLIQAENGKLYGMTSAGGAYDFGVIYEYDITYNSCVKKVDFDGQLKGAKPIATLMQASNGRFYGTTSAGGEYDNGVLFAYDPFTNALSKKIDFNTGTHGAYPNGILVEGAAGKLYGMAAEGGANGKGLIYEYNFLNNSFSVKMSFNGSNGRNPYNNSLVKVTNSKLYGMTTVGGVNDLGVLFEYDIVSNSYIKKVDFGGVNFGASPIGGVIKADNGNLYGATVYGGLNGFGVMFEFDLATNNFNKKLDFIAASGGANPGNLLMQASDGKIYGITSYGGAFNKGILFDYDISKSIYNKRLDFVDKSDGCMPKGSLMLASNNLLYGLTTEGGLYDMGVLFEYDMIKNTYEKKLNFDGEGIGANPSGSLVQTANGKMYGLTPKGGSYGNGVLFEYDHENKILIKKNDFTGTIDGKRPYGSLVYASNDKLYGMTSSGGTGNMGVLFEYDYINETYTKKVEFSGVANGSTPMASLIQAENGKLYGLTSSGGMHQFGVLFEYDYKSNTLVKKVDFDGTTKGRYPMGNLVQAYDGKLYGMTYEGGANNLGVIFSYDPKANIFTKKIDFTMANGSNPRGGLVQSKNGKLYGMTSYGGANNLGVLFEYDFKDNTYAKKMDFDAAHGGNPGSGNLIEVLSIATGIEMTEASSNTLLVFPNPTEDILTIEFDKPIGDISVVNSIGQVIIQKNVVDNNALINLSEYPDGVYFLRLKQHYGNNYKKIVKK